MEDSGELRLWSKIPTWLMDQIDAAAQAAEMAAINCPRCVIGQHPPRGYNLDELCGPCRRQVEYARRGAVAPPPPIKSSVAYGRSAAERSSRARALARRRASASKAERMARWRARAAAEAAAEIHQPATKAENRRDTPDLSADALTAKPARTKRGRLVAAEALQGAVPVLQRISAAYVAHLTRELWLAGWTPAEVVTAIGRPPDGSTWHYPRHVRQVPIWLRHRLTVCRLDPADPTSPVRRPPHEAAAHAEVRARAERRAAEAAARQERRAGQSLRGATTPAVPIEWSDADIRKTAKIILTAIQESQSQEREKQLAAAKRMARWRARVKAAEIHKPKPITPDVWTEDEDATLFAMSMDGFNCPSISKAIDRSIGAIVTRQGRLGINRRSRRRRR